MGILSPHFFNWGIFIPYFSPRLVKFGLKALIGLEFRLFRKNGGSSFQIFPLFTTFHISLLPEIVFTYFWGLNNFSPNPVFKSPFSFRIFRDWEWGLSHIAEGFFQGQNTLLSSTQRLWGRSPPKKILGPTGRGTKQVSFREHRTTLVM